MDKWHNQFDKLKKQWSEYNRINSDYKLHDKRQVAKLGVAWVIKLPGKYFNKPVGWEVEIIDTPLGISERSNKLLKWLRHPPTNAYDNISVFDDSSDILLEDDRQETGYKKKYEHFSSANETQQQFQVPLNEYEIFKKTCCECREKSFKNTSTDYESDIITSSPKQKYVPYSLQPKTSYFDLPPSKTSENNQELSSIVNRSLYSDFEQELQNEVLNEPILSPIRQTEVSKYPKKFSTPKNERRNFSKINQSIETSKVLSDMNPQQKNGHRASINGDSPINIHNHQNDNTIVESDTKNANRASINGRGSPILNHQNDDTIVEDNSRNGHRASMNGRGSPIHNHHNDNTIVQGGTINGHRGRINRRGSPIHNHQYNNTIVGGHTRNGTVISPTTHNTNVGPHIPSIDAFDDNIITRGSSLEQYRNADHIFHPSKDDDLTFRERRTNGHRNHHHNHRHRHGHRRNGNKDASVETVPEDNIFPEFEPSEIREEFDEKEQTIIGN